MTIDDASLLRLVWLASPALPVGGFSYSEGVETAVDSGRVADEAGACRWLLDQLRLALGRSDLPLLAQAFEAWQRRDAPAVQALNDWQRHTRETQEFALQTDQMGRSLAEWLRNDPPAAADPRWAVLQGLKPAPTWPIAFALAAVLSGAPRRQALVVHAFGWAENMVQAAIKAVPLGQAAGQRILAALSAAVPATVDAALAAADDGGERQSYAPMLAILSSHHETQYSRLFRS